MADRPEVRLITAWDRPGAEAAHSAVQRTLEGLSPDSPAYRELNATLQSIEKLVRQLQPLAETLSDNPNALIFDRSPGPDPVPRAPER